MHQDIQNFSDLTAIDTVQVLTIELRYKVHGHCLATICVNDIWYAESGRATITANLFDPISLSVDLVEFREGDSGIELEYFGINGLEILPKYQQLANKPTNYIDFYEQWRLDIPAPFYAWYHQISWQGWIA